MPTKGFDEAFTKYLKELLPTFLKPSKKLQTLLEQLKNQKIQFVILTHCPKHLSEQILNKLKIKEFFPNNCIFYKENLIEKKHKGSKSFELIKKTFNLEYSEMIITEDQKRNLFFPQQLGIKTVLITEQNLFPDKTLPELIPDKKYKSIENFLEDFSTSF